jgi:hypothetical protein
MTGPAERMVFGLPARGTGGARRWKTRPTNYVVRPRDPILRAADAQSASGSPTSDLSGSVALCEARRSSGKAMVLVVEASPLIHWEKSLK